MDDGNFIIEEDYRGKLFFRSMLIFCAIDSTAEKLVPLIGPQFVGSSHTISPKCPQLLRIVLKLSLH